MYSIYFQAHVDKARTWFLTATLRSFEHMAFDRTIDKQNGIFEFFVPVGMETEFLEIMRYYQDQGIILWLRQLPNRLQHDQSGD